MKRRLKILATVFVLLLCGFAYGQQSNVLEERRQTEDDLKRVVCRCSFWGNCKASARGNLCAQGKPGGNIDCSSYRGNC